MKYNMFVAAGTALLTAGLFLAAPVEARHHEDAPVQKETTVAVDKTATKDKGATQETTKSLTKDLAKTMENDAKTGADDAAAFHATTVRLIWPAAQSVWRCGGECRLVDGSSLYERHRDQPRTLWGESGEVLLESLPVEL